MRHRRRAYISILGLGISSLLVDKLLLGAGGPVAALAAQAAGPAAGTASETSYNELRTLLATPEGREAWAMIEARSGGAARDVFKPGVLWTATQAASDTSPTEEASSDARYSVSSVVLGRTPVAMINGRAYRVGDAIESAVSVVAIDAEGVVIERNGRRERLVLASTDPSLLQSGRVGG